MQITVDTKHDDPQTIMLAIGILSSLPGVEELFNVRTATGAELDVRNFGAVPEGTTKTAAPLPPPPADIASNILPFPAPPPPPPPPADTAAVPPTPPAATNAAAAPGVASVEYDKAGMPWDARIHQKGHSKKKDGTWKLKKGVDPKIVEAVVRELAAAKLPATVTGAPAAASAAQPVPLPPAAGPVPVPPPPPPATAVTELPASSVAAPVPVPGAPALGGLPASPGAYRALVDKIMAATKEGKLTAQKVSEIVQSHGAPNLMTLNSMSHLIPEVNASVDAAIAGLM